jgi:hypothetical protein
VTETYLFKLDGLLPAGVRLEPGPGGLGNRWVCDCGETSTVSNRVEFLMSDYSKHLNVKHRRR